MRINRMSLFNLAVVGTLTLPTILLILFPSTLTKWIAVLTAIVVNSVLAIVVYFAGDYLLQIGVGGLKAMLPKWMTKKLSL